MSDAEVFKVKNRLAQHVVEPGGMTAGMANTRAARELAAQQGKYYEAIGDKLLCRSAYILCELADKLRTQDREDWASIKVHVDGMRLIWNTEESGREALSAMVDGLWALTERLRIVE